MEAKKRSDGCQHRDDPGKLISEIFPLDIRPLCVNSSCEFFLLDNPTQICITFRIIDLYQAWSCSLSKLYQFQKTILIAGLRERSTKGGVLRCWCFPGFQSNVNHFLASLWVENWCRITSVNGGNSFDGKKRFSTRNWPTILNWWGLQNLENPSKDSP